MYIYDGEQQVQIESYSISELEDKLILLKYDEVTLLDEAQSKIWTHIVSQFNGLEVFDKTFDISCLADNKVGYQNIVGVNWQTTYSLNETNKNIKIVGTGNFTETYEPTVENIASSIIVHEWYSHGIKHVGDKYKSHRLAYENVMSFKRLWDNTTKKYKDFNKL